MGIDIKKIEQLTKNFNSPEYQKQLRKVSEEFAAWYVYEVFKKMYDTVPKSGLLQESFGERWFREMLLQQYSLKAARTDLKDLSDMIYRSLGGKTLSEDVNSAKSFENKMNMLNALNSLISQNKESGE
ncbi:MAG: rod-binding protein [Fervidobacterium sp.]|uniref:Rod binding protein domain-containing protein n=1 Tax=Fervidobacterium gondwanense DSM 13020 TaxID=1121883 RepID=A0A1M7T1U8_FERGO|nr:rod-binding protein [Fervidobacterium gondwanense]SHN64730.1 Rod binding protein domain-containing protein [Fervidobacterium gondwanense DSM 13020]